MNVIILITLLCQILRLSTIEQCKKFSEVVFVDVDFVKPVSFIDLLEKSHLKLSTSSAMTYVTIQVMMKFHFHPLVQVTIHRLFHY